MVLACCILIMHAVVPHHHHDSCGDAGFVYESEVGCNCSCDEPLCDEHQSHHHEGESHHPLNHCKLQDLLAQLVVSHKMDETYMALALIPECDLIGICSGIDFSIYDTHMEWLPAAPDVPLPTTVELRHIGLRAPPAC